MYLHRFAPLMLLALAACQEETASVCGADGLQDLVDKAPDMMGMMELPADYRLLGPDDVATTDFLPERLNISVDEDGIVTRVWCG